MSHQRLAKKECTGTELSVPLSQVQASSEDGEDDDDDDEGDDTAAAESLQQVDPGSSCNSTPKKRRLAEPESDFTLDQIAAIIGIVK